MLMITEGAKSLAEAMFGHAQLGDRRRTKRLVDAFDRMCRHPGGSLPTKIASPKDLKALYRLMDCTDVTHEAIIAPLREYTLANIAHCKDDVLILHDGTELNYTSRKSMVEDMGQVGTGAGQGYICHQALAVSAATGRVLGLADQILHCRPQTPKCETLPERRARQSRESRLWITGTLHLPADRRLIDVADQGADTFEFLHHEYHSGRRFVVRAYKPRKVQAGHGGQGAMYWLADYAGRLPELGRFIMDVQPQKHRVARKDAEFLVAGGPLLIHLPHAKCGEYGDRPLPLYVVLVKEVQPPKNEKPIEWLLLTNEPIHKLADAWRVTGWYEKRWIIEEYHKGQKTGVGIEQLQFTSVERLQPAIALVSAVALTLLELRDASRLRDAHTRPATEVVDKEYVEVLSTWRYQEVRMNWSAYDFYYALGRLGGHQNRKNDKRPGWLVLWRGWEKLQAMLTGYHAARRKKCG
jgi:hypothetical protein